MKTIDGNVRQASVSAASLVELCAPVNKRIAMIKKSLALTALLFFSFSCAATTPTTSLNYEQLSAAVKQSDRTSNELSGLAGTPLTLDLRSTSGRPYLASSADLHGMTFICQNELTDFTGGPVNATLLKYEMGDDRRDLVTLEGCTQLER